MFTVINCKDACQTYVCSRKGNDWWMSAINFSESPMLSFNRALPLKSFKVIFILRLNDQFIRPDKQLKTESISFSKNLLCFTPSSNEMIWGRGSQSRDAQRASNYKYILPVFINFPPDPQECRFTKWPTSYLLTKNLR